ncbi:MAG: hypothetical protein IJL87_01545 [Clostridia bacterium]|nr:hypothetical protein [Clostridia bacterium]
MKTVKRVLAALMIFTLIACSMTSCNIASVFTYTIEGSWKELDNYVGMCQFNSNGTFAVHGLGYVATGTYVFHQGKQTKDESGRKTVSGDISMDYKEITYTNEEGKEVTEPFFYTFVEVTTEMVEVEVVNPFNEENVKKEWQEVTTETEYKYSMAEAVKGHYTIVQQTKSPEKLTIVFNAGFMSIKDEDGNVKRISVPETKWAYERSYDVI